MADQLAEMPDLAQKIQAVYEWNILQNGKVAGVWSKFSNHLDYKFSLN